MEDLEIIREFLIESTENLARLDQELVELERRPRDAALLASVFRTIHTIKGTCGFLGFGILEATTHHAENLLSLIRNGEKSLTPNAVSLVLETVDAVRRLLNTIESKGEEGQDEFAELRHRLQEACKADSDTQKTTVAVVDSPVLQPEPATSPELVIMEAPKVEVSPVHAVADVPVFAPTPAPAPQQAESTAADTRAAGSSVAESTIRVGIELLDKLMNLVGELVLARNQILQVAAVQQSAGLNSTCQRLNLITSELQENVMRTRMQPIGVVWNKLPRVVRDLAASCGKQISLEMEGAETELDKTIVEAIKDPLTHIVRNCCDHGLETAAVRVQSGKPAQGKVLMRAYHEGGQVNIEIIDDGAGINTERVKRKALERGLLRPEQIERMNDREAVNLVFLPGFSTAEKVTNISGRGVGTDVVKTNIENIGGVVELASQQGKGTTIKIKIPLTLAIIPGLIVSCAGERFILPQATLQELIRLESRTVDYIGRLPVLRRRGSLLPLVFLREILQLSSSGTDDGVYNVVVLRTESGEFGLVVDTVNDTQEIVVKALGRHLKKLDYYAGASIMGDGQIALILDAARISRKANLTHERVQKSDVQKIKDDKKLETYLLFRAGQFERVAVPLSRVDRLEEFKHSRIEYTRGQPVVQYRENLLPLISMSELLNSGSSEGAFQRDPVQAIVFETRRSRIAIAVDEILDIANAALEEESGEARELMQSTVLDGKVTDLIDVSRLLEGLSHHCLIPEESASAALLALGDGVGVETADEVLA